MALKVVECCLLSQEDAGRPWQRMRDPGGYRMSLKDDEGG